MSRAEVRGHFPCLMNGVLSMQVALNVVRCDGVVYVISQQIVQVIMRWEDDMVSLQYPTTAVSFLWQSPRFPIINLSVTVD